MLFFNVPFSFGYNRGLFQVNSGKLFNSIKCISQLKGWTINSQPGRESDQTCWINMIVLVILFNSFSGRFLLFSKAHRVSASGSCLSMSDYADRFRLGGIVA